MNQRFVGLDILRIIAGFFVILMHTTDPFLLSSQYIGGSSWYLIYYLNILGKVAVPIFVMISGYLLLNSKKIEDITTFYKRRIKRVGIPLLLWLLVLFVWKYFWFHIQITPSYIYKTITTVDIGPLYFLVIILELYLLTPFFLKIIVKNNKIQFSKVILFLLVSMLSIGVPFFVFKNSFSLSQSIITIAIPYAFYFILGGYLRNVSFKAKNIFILFLIYLATPFLIIFLAKGDLSSYLTNYFSPSVIIMSISFFIFILSFEKKLQKIKNFSLKALGVISSSILGIYLVHPYVLDYLKGYTILSPGHIYSPLWLSIFGIVIFVFMLCFLIVTIGKKLPYLKIMFDS